MDCRTLYGNIAKMKTRYKFLKTGYKSGHGDMKWKVGKWYTHDGGLDMCQSGFHCSKGIYQAFNYVQGPILAKVEVDGKSIIEDDKEVWEKMRIIKSWRWTKRDSVLFSIYAASLVLKNFEKKHPNDKRPRQAIQAAKRWVNSPTKKNMSAAESAGGSAWPAACSAAGSAWSAAESTVGSAVRSAVWSADSAARSAARFTSYKKLDKWMKRHLKNLRVLQQLK